MRHRVVRLLLSGAAAAGLLLAGLGVRQTVRVRTLHSAQAQWRALGIRDYVVHVRVQCFCLYTGTTYRVTVRDAQIAAVVPLDPPNTPLRAAAAREAVTVDTLFRWLDDAYRGRGSRVDVRYSKRYHFPESARIESGAGTDGEWSFVVEHFVPSAARRVSGARLERAAVAVAPGVL